MIYHTLFNKIAEKCHSIHELYNMMQIQSIPKYHQQIMMINCINQRLKELNLDSKDIAYGLSQYGCIMSGSFPLQCLLGEYWKESDIDIYTFCKYPKNLKNGDIYGNKGHMLRKEHEHLIEICLWPMCTQKYPNAFLKVEDSDMINYGDGPLFYREYNCEKIRIQCIYVEDRFESLHKFVENSFDLSFCSTVYDGNQIILGDTIENLIKKQGYVYISKTISEDYFGRYHKTKGRIDKYKQRDFKILNMDDFRIEIYVLKKYGIKPESLHSIIFMFGLNKYTEVKNIYSELSQYIYVENINKDYIVLYLSIVEKYLIEHLLKNKDTLKNIVNETDKIDTDLKSLCNFSSLTQYENTQLCSEIKDKIIKCLKEKLHISSKFWANYLSYININDFHTNIDIYSKNYVVDSFCYIYDNFIDE